mmetsp:Transcript_97235/g.145700  ORF Transcript_97235/g.145700 Transcript_97235/m.145700 type:complete len:183 (+) Transcript_97235:517-1065(+)
MMVIAMTMRPTVRQVTTIPSQAVIATTNMARKRTTRLRQSPPLRVDTNNREGSNSFVAPDNRDFSFPPVGSVSPERWLARSHLSISAGTMISESDHSSRHFVSEHESDENDEDDDSHHSEDEHDTADNDTPSSRPPPCDPPALCLQEGCSNVAAKSCCNKQCAQCCAEYGSQACTEHSAEEQ